MLDPLGPILANARILAGFCQLAYGPETALPSLPGWKCYHWNYGRLTGVMVWDTTNLVLAFRGTKTLVDWMADLDALQVPGYGGLVHAGFERDLESGWYSLTSLLQSNWARLRPTNLWVTGHSLGGAMAILAAARLQRMVDLPNPRLVTFAAPRVFNQAAAQAYTLLTQLAFRARGDIIPELPGRWMAHGYDDLGIVHMLPDIWPHTILHPLASLWQLLRHGPVGLVQRWLAAHHISNYLKLLADG